MPVPAAAPLRVPRRRQGPVQGPSAVCSERLCEPPPLWRHPGRNVRAPALLRSALSAMTAAQPCFKHPTCILFILCRRSDRLGAPGHPRQPHHRRVCPRAGDRAAPADAAAGAHPERHLARRRGRGSGVRGAGSEWRGPRAGGKRLGQGDSACCCLGRAEDVLRCGGDDCKSWRPCVPSPHGMWAMSCVPHVVACLWKYLWSRRFPLLVHPVCNGQQGLFLLLPTPTQPTALFLALDAADAPCSAVPCRAVPCHAGPGAGPQRDNLGGRSCGGGLRGGQALPEAAQPAGERAGGRGRGGGCKGESRAERPRRPCRCARATYSFSVRGMR